MKTFYVCYEYHYKRKLLAYTVIAIEDRKRGKFQEECWALIENDLLEVSYH